jgi:EAL domain-containing protein (putative c-di-GMP-specific phosphodiesterase class I)
MPAERFDTLSDPSGAVTVDHLLFLPPNLVTAQRLRGELAAAELAVDASRRGLRVAVGEVDWRALLEGISTVLSDHERRGTRVAIIARGADERSERKAIAVARSLAEILERYSDTWLHGLLERRGLCIHFQPLVQYPPGRVHGYECLVRGVGSTGKLIAPARLFDAAGRLGMAYLLDQQSCKAAVAGAADVGFSNIQFFINIMAGAIDNPTVHAESCLAAVEIGGLRPEQITFEIVDAEACRDRKRLRELLECYRDAGFNVSLDDVGDGAASLLSLEELRPDYIKLDADLCRRAVMGGSHAEVLRQLIETARQRGVIAIAKAIETEDQLRFAIDAGVRLTQGYVHAHPAATPLEAPDEDQVLRQVRRTAIVAV